MQDKTSTEVLIDGRKYNIGGFESAEYLQQVAGYINRKVTDLKKLDDYGKLDFELRSTLLAINITDDYYKEREKNRDNKAETEQKDKKILDMKHEIMDLKDKQKESDKNLKDTEKKLENAEKKIVELETRLKSKK